MKYWNSRAVQFHATLRYFKNKVTCVIFLKGWLNISWTIGCFQRTFLKFCKIVKDDFVMEECMRGVLLCYPNLSLFIFTLKDFNLFIPITLHTAESTIYWLICKASARSVSLKVYWLIDWLDSVLRRFSNISAM